MLLFNSDKSHWEISLSLASLRIRVSESHQKVSCLPETSRKCTRGGTPRRRVMMTRGSSVAYHPLKQQLEGSVTWCEAKNTHFSTVPDNHVVV